MNKKGKTWIWIVLIVLAIVVIGGYAVVNKFTGSSTTAAFIVTNGAVEVDSGNGFVTAVSNQEVALGDVVKTTSGTADLVLYEGAIVSLDSNSLVRLEKLAKSEVIVHVIEGKVWSRITDITGKRNVIVTTKEGKVSALGTAFSVGADGTVFVGDGKVKVEVDGKKQELREFKKVKLQDGAIVKAKLTDNDYQQIKGDIKGDIEALKELRWREARKHQDLLDQAKEKYGITDESINEYLERVDSGEILLDDVVEMIPVKFGFVDKLIKITEEIISLQQEASELDEM